MKITLRVAAVASLSSLALFVGTAATAYADANPNNHGHHYGQLKHPKVTPPPAPSPAPGPQSIPSPSPLTNPLTIVSGGTTIVIQQPQQASQPTAPVATSPSPISSTIRIADAAPSGDVGDWLLLILASLLAVWLIALVGLVRAASQLGRKALRVRAAPAQA